MIDLQKETLIELPKELYNLVFPTGSSVICNPPVLDTDRDYMFYTENMCGLIMHLLDTGWVKSKTVEYNQDTRPIVSLKKDNLNFVLTNNIEVFSKYNTATKLAKKLNLLGKQQRVDLFTFIIEGKV